jgi:hypothetical protein
MFTLQASIYRQSESFPCRLGSESLGTTHVSRSRICLHISGSIEVQKSYFQDREDICPVIEHKPAAKFFVYHGAIKSWQVPCEDLTASTLQIRKWFISKRQKSCCHPLLAFQVEVFLSRIQEFLFVYAWDIALLFLTQSLVKSSSSQGLEGAVTFIILVEFALRGAFVSSIKCCLMLE